ncbi:MAG TPA: hypothetical protein VLG50_02855 [Candidatus Saccharimonadales bacterium]|nr:hypothetical protein [Candidatus Saccharimonadales bacterium]
MVQQFYFKTIFITYFLSGFLCAQKSSFDEIQKKYEEPLSLFLSMQQKKMLTDGLLMNQFFLSMHKPCSQLIPQMRKDNQSLKKEIKKLKRMHRNREINQEVAEKKIQELKSYHQNYVDMYAYVKQYHLNNDVAVFHQDLKHRWSKLLDCINQGGNIVLLLKECNIDQPDVLGLKELIARVKLDQQKVSEYEDRLHTDWIDLKLANYVYKIELIRLRNAAFFHPLYHGMNIKSVYPKW